MKVEDYLRYSDMSHADLARFLDISPATLSNYLRGRRKMPLEVALKIYHLSKFRVGIEDLLIRPKKI